MMNERMSDAEQMELLMSLQKEMVEMKRRNEETKRKNEDEILALRRENEEMKRKFVEGGPSVGPTHLVRKSFTTLTGPRTVKESKDKIYTQEVDDESYPNRPVPTIGTLDSARRHPFTDSIVGVSLLNKWKGFNKDRYDGLAEVDEHMDVYITHMSLYTSDDAVLCRVFPTSLKERAMI